MRYLFDFLFALTLILIAPLVLLKMIVTGKYRRGLGQRLGWIKFRADDRPVIWVHGVSVGELQAAKGLVESLRQAYPNHRLVITHTTRTGETVAKQLYPDLDRFYFPLDFSFVVRRVLKRVAPKLIVLIELELWPNFLVAAHAKKIPVLLANGRISQCSFEGYGKVSFALKPAFRAISKAAVQDDEYAARLAGLYQKMGLDDASISVAGNLKFDSVPFGLDQAARVRYRELFGFADDELVLVCGSTHPGEHEELVKLYKNLRDSGLRMRMVVVPRHPERWNSVRSIWRTESVPLVDRSSLGSGRMMAVDDGQSAPPCVLLDTMGELTSLYNAADMVFVGGSLIAHGGQNMAEPAGLARAVLFGPNTQNFKSTVRDLLEARAAIRVENWAELEKALTELAQDEPRRQAMGERAQRVVEAGKGAVDRHMKLIHEMLEA